MGSTVMDKTLEAVEERYFGSEIPLNGHIIPWRSWNKSDIRYNLGYYQPIGCAIMELSNGQQISMYTVMSRRTSRKHIYTFVDIDYLAIHIPSEMRKFWVQVTR